MFPLYSFAFLLGDLFLQTFAQLPTLLECGGLCLLFLIALRFVRFKRLILLSLFFLFGMIYTTLCIQQRLNWTLPKDLENRVICITGSIASIPEATAWGRKFIFFMEKIYTQKDQVVVNKYVQLNWPKVDTHLMVGDRYKLFVKLKRIHAVANPGGFDYEAWALQKNIRAKGNVVIREKHQLLSSSYLYPVERIRAHMNEKILNHLPATPTAVWLPTLMIGEHNNVPKEHWEVLRRTGTNHLMAIAGLHIGTIAGFTYMIMNWLWRRSTHLLLIIPASHAASCAALCVAIIYSFLAGFSLPTQRACIMLSVFTVAHLSKKYIDAWNVFAIAMLIVLMINPLAVLSESFWLSFGTIALIIYAMHHRISPRGWWWKWGRMQWIVGIGLIPITLTFFQQCSLISFIANTIAIPWLSFLILPFCFLSNIFIFISEPIANLLIAIADKNLELLWSLLTFLSRQQFAVWHQTFSSQFTLLFGFVSVLTYLLPSGMPGRYLSFFLFLPVIFNNVTKPAKDEFHLTVLDVGQGLAVVVQTNQHNLIFDTGPKYNTSDAGESTLLPYLRTQGIKKIDALVISHSDNDHVGGAATILANMLVKKVYASSTKKISVPVKICEAGHKWQWDGVQFHFLFPSVHDNRYGNDRSCVLRIDNGKFSVLLTGDIEKYAEEKILETNPTLNTDILLAPHHGSKTSSGELFISKVSPKIVVYATGYLNRYGFPHAKVIQVYKHFNTQQFNTAYTGAIQFKLTQKKLSHQFYRKDHKRYWYDES